MDNVMVAFLFGGLSALSLPLGAALGLWLRPGLRFTAAVMAFGAGALLCALAIEIVVPSLEHFPDQPITGFVWLASGALFGCLLFIGLDQLLSRMGGYLRKASTIAAKLKRSKKQHYRKMLEHLSVVDLMLALPPEQIRRVLTDIEKRVFQAGEIISHEADPIDALYLVESGQVMVYQNGKEGSADSNGTLLGAGEAFGETALMQSGRSIRRAVAVADTVLWEVHKDDFEEIAEASPELSQRLRLLAAEPHRHLAAAEISTQQTEHWLQAAKRNIDAAVSNPTETEVIQAANAQRRGGSNVALAIWLGIALDGIPESLIIGSTMEGATVSLALIGGLFLANVPESMSSAVVMKGQGGKTWSIMLMWTALMVMTAVGAAVGHMFIAEAPRELQALLEGMAAGAMLAMVAQTMLPEAYAHGGWLTGLMTVCGFLAAIFMGTLDQEKRELSHTLGDHPVAIIEIHRRLPTG
ncbi:MAG: cyclic nucleotide-binding domain-containing protein [Xanthomonadales bacterium]|nr:cyclic nucleotide-binding domain-containing protein [Xanthomonadales bacterium]